MTFSRRVAIESPPIIGVPLPQFQRLQKKFNDALLQAEEGGLPPGAGTDTPQAQVFGAGTVGTAEDGWAPLSHIHPMSSTPPSALGAAESEGTSSVPSRADHAHGRKIEVQHNGSLVAVRRQINLIDGATSKFTVADNAGSDRVDVTPAAVDTTRGTKTLVEATATGMFEVAITAGQQATGILEFGVTTTDGTDFETYSARLTYVGHNKTGTVTAAISAAAVTSAIQSAGAGITVTFAAVAGANKFTIQATATTGLGGVPVHTARWVVLDLTARTVTAV